MKTIYSSTHKTTLPRREYGKTGEFLSIVGFGGIVVMGSEQTDANRIVAEAVERGVNYFDVAPTYGDAEERLGPALKPYRDKVFLACKTAERICGPAIVSLRKSLDHLQTDHFDLFQLHGLVDVEKDVDVAFSKGGVMEMVVNAKKEGRIRYIGFSAHTEEAALAAMNRYAFDSILFPINFACWHKSGFGMKVMEKAQKSGLPVLALKAMARQLWQDDKSDHGEYSKCWYEPLTNLEQAALALRWTLSQPVVAAIAPGVESLFFHAVDVATNFSPITSDEERQLKSLAQSLNSVFSCR